MKMKASHSKICDMQKETEINETEKNNKESKTRFGSGRRLRKLKHISKVV